MPTLGWLEDSVRFTTGISASCPAVGSDDCDLLPPATRTNSTVELDRDMP